MLRSAMMAGVIALGCVGISQPADAQWFSGGHFHHRNQFFFSFGFPGYGFGGYPYYPYYPAYYYPPYYPYPYYPPYAAYPGGYSAAGPGGYPGGYPAAANRGATSTVDPATVREVQDGLAQRGYDVGPIDGRLGPRTKAAIRAYEQDNGLAVDGLPSRTLRNHLQSHSTG